MKVNILISILIAAIFPLLENEEEKTSKAESITVSEIRDHMFFLASDYLRGRVAGSEGYSIAAEYAVSQLRQAGLQPIIVDEKGNKTFYQHFTATIPIFMPGRIVKLMSADGESTFPVESIKFCPLGRHDLYGRTFSVVFVGFAIEEPKHQWNDMDGLELEGKIAVVLLGAPTAGGKPILPEEVHRKYLAVKGFFRKAENLIFKKGCPALLIVTNEANKPVADEILSGMDEHTFQSEKSDRSSRRDKIPIIGIISDDFGRILFRDQVLNPYEPKAYKTFELENISLSFRAKIDIENAACKNIVAVVPGSDPNLDEQYVTLGAHLDHIPPSRGQICNGADDNASGGVGIIEIAEAVAMSPPRRTVIFCLYDAEEYGLRGSQYFVKHCPVPVEDIIVNINLDMIGRYDRESLARRNHYVRGAEGAAAELRKTIIAVNKRTVNWPLVFQHPSTYTASSDQVPFQRIGIPAARFFSGDHEDLHKPTDDPEKINFEKMQKISQLVYEITMELANREQPPKADNETD